MLEAKQALAQAKASKGKIEKQPFSKNTFKCSACMRVHHAEHSPLVLCDYCPRSFHLACLEVPEGGLPQGEWACPKCWERHEQSKAKLQGLRVRKAQALQRVQTVRSHILAVPSSLFACAKRQPVSCGYGDCLVHAQTGVQQLLTDALVCVRKEVCESKASH